MIATLDATLRAPAFYAPWRRQRHVDSERYGACLRAPLICPRRYVALLDADGH